MMSCYIWCVQVIPERARILYFNEKYVEGLKVVVKRYSRRSNYYVNIEANIKYECNNNVTVHLIFYEFLHNEYKRSFVELHFRLCDLVNKDPYLGKALANAGLTSCPVPKGKIAIHNITIPTNDFPNVWPFERCKVDIRFEVTTTNELIANYEIYVFFKDRDVILKYSKNSKN
ncbi:uncharacterized protein LOC134747900 [Cydia strobilella]|uniref:uncharacterized protein LOC134747900 n=1 Tax=Cydia strobilella TaxID=1100964 RepID=UPI003007CAF9